MTPEENLLLEFAADHYLAVLYNEGSGGELTTSLENLIWARLEDYQLSGWFPRGINEGHVLNVFKSLLMWLKIYEADVRFALSYQRDDEMPNRREIKEDIAAVLESEGSTMSSLLDELIEDLTRSFK